MLCFCECVNVVFCGVVCVLYVVVVIMEFVVECVWGIFFWVCFVFL